MTKKYQKVQKKIAEIVERCETGDFIFRGENRCYDKISSTLYRNYKNITQEDGAFSITIEKDIIKEAGAHFPINTPNIDILTELQHHGGSTSLIDFTKNLFIALFFACDGSRGASGRVILFAMKKLKEKQNQDISYEERGDYIFIPPHSKNPRVIFQSGVFVHATRGYIQNKDVTIIDIGSEIKDGILEYLREIFNIHTRTIYNDVQGFIRNQKNYPKVVDETLQGLSKLNEREPEASIEHFNNAIRTNPQHAIAYLWRGVARYGLGKYQESIKDFDKSIEINPNNYDVYFWRGRAKLATQKTEEAIDDYKKLVEIDPQNRIRALILQAAIQEKKGQYEAALQNNEEILKRATQNGFSTTRKMVEERIKKLKEKIGCMEG